MFELEARAVRLGASAMNRDEAVRQVGALLADVGRTDPSYTESMLRREAVGATYVGNGVAIPHGMRDDAALVRQTGVVGIQYPKGVEWTPGETAHLVFGIAAKGAEHIAFLSRLTDVALHPETAARLVAITDPGEFLALLRLGEAVRKAPKRERLDERFSAFPFQRELAIVGPHGMHARPASIFASIARKFSAEVRLSHGDRIANGKSVASLLSLGAKSGSVVRLMTRGEDGELALAALTDAVACGLEAGEAFASPFLTVATPIPAALLKDTAYTGQSIAGIAASPGVAVGKVQHLPPEEPANVPPNGVTPAIETTRLNDALVSALAQIRDLHNVAISQFGEDRAGIIEAQAEFLSDPGLIDEAHDHIAQGHSAEWAWQDVTLSAAESIARIPDPILAARAADIRDVSRRVLRILNGTSPRKIAARHAGVILVTDDLSPTDAVGIDRQRIMAIVTAGGSPSSHTVILARALGIPVVVGLGSGCAAAVEDSTIVVDGDRGLVLIAPTIRDLALAERHRANRDAALAASLASAYQPAFTRDGLRIEVVANIGQPDEAATAVEAGAEGVGLARTELLFADRDTMPSEADQREVYRSMVRAMNGLPLAIRTLDISGEKRLAEFAAPQEANPFLGERGLRLSFARPDLFAAQLRALASAAHEGPLRILLPMVSTRYELRKAREMIEAARKMAGSPTLSVGLMVEVPSAAIMADRLAPDVDFISIGTNELTQYVLAIDRQHPRLAHLADDLHPAVLRLIAETVRAGESAGVKVGVSGSIASNARAAPLLIGLGITTLSAAATGVPVVKQKIRELSAEKCRILAAKALDCAEADDVRSLLWAEGS